MYEKGKCLLVVIGLLAGLSGGVQGATSYLSGDANGDAVVSVADSTFVLSYLFTGAYQPDCLAAADPNNDGSVNLSDAIFLLNQLFYHGEPAVNDHAWLSCDIILSRVPLVDEGYAVSLGDGLKDGDQVVMPILVWGDDGLLQAWTLDVIYPADTLELSEVLFPDEELYDAVFKFPGGLPGGGPEPGRQKLGVVFDFMMTHFFPVAEAGGTKIADLVFTVKDGDAEAVDVNLSDAYGACELVFGPAPTFPFVSGGKALLGDALPAMPEELSVYREAGSVELAWVNGQTYDNVLVERDGQVIATLEGDAAAYTDEPPSGRFAYRIRGRKDGAVSAGAFAFVRNFTLMKPENPSIHRVDQDWTFAWENGDDYDAVVVERNGEVVDTLPGDAQTYVIGNEEHLMAVFHVYGKNGSGRSIRAAAYPDGIGVSGDGAENLTYAFQEDGTLLLSWDAQAGVDRYDIERDFEVIGQCLGGETFFTDTPDLQDMGGVYHVVSYAGDEALGWSSCKVTKKRPLEGLTARGGDDPKTIEISWMNADIYVSVLVYRNGVRIAALPGDSERFAYTFEGDDDAPALFGIQAIGETFYTEEAEIKLSDPSLQTSQFLRGDANSDGTVSIADVILIRRYLFLGDVVPGCMDAADANDDGSVNLSDCIVILSCLYLDGPIFPEPYPVPGFDLTGDAYWCDSVDIVPGEKTTDLLAIGDVEAGVGQEVTVPIYLTHAGPVDAFQLIIQYDPSQFTPNSSSTNGHSEPGSGLDFTNSIMTELYDEPIHFTVLTDVPEEGYMIVSAVQSFVDDMPIPPGEDQLLVELRGRLADDLTVDDVVDITPYNGENDEGVGPHRLRNEITATGEANYVTFYPRTKGGAIRIKDNPLTMDFIRGDANCDGLVNLADPIHTLNYLYSVGIKPSCTDAADANDDGSLDLSDPIYVLDYLFGDAPKSGPGAMDVSFGECHPDTTNDSLRGCIYEFCPRN